MSGGRAARGNLQKKKYMEKRVLGIILSILGIAGLIIAAVNFMGGGEGARHLKSIIVFAILGVVFFSSGIGLVRNTNDRAT
jgi:hypothetical protein